MLFEGIIIPILTEAVLFSLTTASGASVVSGLASASPSFGLPGRDIVPPSSSSSDLPDK